MGSQPPGHKQRLARDPRPDLLNKLGYDVGAPDGLVDERTRQAIKRFQQPNGLDETGEVSIPLVTKLEHLTS